jgi:hypothetical protein
MDIKFDDETRARFLDKLRETCNVSAACREIGISLSTADNYRKAFPAFAEAWEHAIAEASDNLEQEARRRAMHGIETPVLYQGQPTYILERDRNGHIVEEEYDTGMRDLADKPIMGRRAKLSLDVNGNPRVLTIRAYSDSLMALLLKAHKPDKYRENTSLELSGKGGGPVQLSDVEKAARIKAIFEAAKRRRLEEDNADLV